MIDDDGKVKEEFDVYYNISNSYNKDTLVNDDGASISTLVPDDATYVSDDDAKSYTTLVNKLGKLSLLPTELGITKEELARLNYNELIVIKEAINREYAARAKEFERDIKESINSELKKLKRKSIFINGVVDSEKLSDDVVMNITKKDLMRGQKREALVEIARLWQMIKEQRAIRNKKLEQLLDEHDILVSEKTGEGYDDTIENDDILKKAIVNVSKTVKLNANKVNEKLYKEFIEEASKMDEIEQDEFYDSLDTIQKDIKVSILGLYERVDEEIVALKHYQDLLESELWKLQDKEHTSSVRELFKSYIDLEAYINIYKKQKKEIDNILTTYNECERTGILFEKEDMLSDNIDNAMDEQITQMASLVDKTRLTISRRVAEISKKMQDIEQSIANEREKQNLDIVVTKESLYVINLLGMSLLSANKSSNEIRAMTTEERFLAKEVEMPEKELEINDYENTSWGKELYTTASILYQLIKNKDGTEMRKQVSQYKINNDTTVDSVKDKIDGANKREYSNDEYESALKVVKDSLHKFIHNENELDIDSLTSEDCRVLAQMIDEECIKNQKEQEEDIKYKLLDKLKDDSGGIFEVIKNGYRDIGKSLIDLYKQKNMIRDSFNVVIAQKELSGTTDTWDKIQQSILVESGVVNADSYSDYMAKYKKEQVATPKDIDSVLKKVCDTSVGGGYYYVVLDNEKNDLMANIGDPVISIKGITIFKVDENRLSFDQDSGKFFETIFMGNHDYSEVIRNGYDYTKSLNNGLELSKDRMYTVEQDREFDKTMQLINDEEIMLREDNLFGMYRDNGIPKLSSGLERKVKYADVTLDMLKYIHTRDGNTEYDQEEELIKGLSDKLSDLKNAFENQHYNIKKLKSALDAYREFKSNISMSDSIEVDENIKNIFYGEYRKAKDEFLSLSDYIKSKANDLFEYQYKIDQEKFRIDVRQEKLDKEEKNKESNVTHAFFPRLKKFFLDIVQSIKNIFRPVVQLFTPRGVKVKVNDLITTALGVDNSKGSREGMKQWLTEIWTMDNELYKDEYMKLAKRRDEENRKKAIDEKEKNSVLLESGSVLYKDDVNRILSKKFRDSVGKLVDEDKIVMERDIEDVESVEKREVRKKIVNIDNVSYKIEKERNKNFGSMNK